MKRKLNVMLLTVISMIFTSQLSAQVPYGLNSNPSAIPTIFLDFDGQTVVSPYWNGGNPIFCTPTELNNAQMIRVFNQVAEDYMPFTINVTTDSTVYYRAPLNRRAKVIVTPTSAWWGSSGGVRYIDCFSWGLELPAFVFSTLLLNNDKRVAEAASHEAGHNLGLYHQASYNSSCGFVAEYNAGTGAMYTETSWAPIMGNGYYRNLTLWHNGSSSRSCSDIQDDKAVITRSVNGITLRADDVSSVRTSATNINFTGNNYALSGIITDTADVDYFKVNLTKAGRFRLMGLPDTVKVSLLNSPNLDLEITIENSNGAQVKKYNPRDAVDVTLDTSLMAGTYYIKVNSVGNTNISRYGMAGSYDLVGSFTASSSLPVYSLVLNGNNNKGKHELNWSIVADEALESITVETSEDGKSFSKIKDVEGTSRAFAYQPVTAGNRFYRLHVVTASQLEYFSNIVNIKSSTNNAKFSILNNRISGNEIVVNSKGNYNYRLLDMGGRSIQSGRMNIGFNRISSPAINSGMYLIQVIDGTEVITERLMVQ